MLYDETYLQESQPPQTGMEMEGSPVEDRVRHLLEDPLTQTGSESGDGPEFQSDPNPGEAEDTLLPQTGSKMGENGESMVLKTPCPPKPG